MTKIKEVRHIVNKKVGEENGEAILEPVNRVEYEFGDEVSAEAKEKVRNHIPQLTNKSEIRRVIESVDG
jgi:hypothetical protein